MSRPPAHPKSGGRDSQPPGLMPMNVHWVPTDYELMEHWMGMDGHCNLQHFVTKGNDREWMDRAI